MTFTPTQQKFMDLLGDGRPHAKADLAACLWDELAKEDSIQMHFSNMRKQLNPAGLDIVTKHIQGRIHYMLVRLLTSPV